MQVLLLATNETTKLEPISNTLPASLIPVINRPVMEILIELLARKGFKKLLVSLYNQGGAVVSHFGTGRRWGVHIDYVMQREAWGDAGSVGWLGNAITETVLVLPTDIIIDFDVENALAAHEKSGAVLTFIASRQNQYPNQMLLIDEYNNVLDKNANDSKNQVDFTGAFFCDPNVLKYINNQSHSSIYNDVFPKLLSANEVVRTYIIESYWNPLATFPQYEEAQQIFLYNSLPTMSENAIRTIDIPTVFPLSVPGNQIAPGIWIGLNTVIHPSARLAPPLCIGEGCLIGYNAELGPGTVIGPSVVVDDEATIQHSTILRRSYVGRLVNISHRLVHQSKMIDLATGYHIDIEDKFLISRVALPGWQKNIFFRIIDIFVAIILIFVLMPLIILMVLLIMIFISRKPFDVKSCYGRRAFENRSKYSVQIVRILAFRTASKNGSVKTLGKIIRFCGIERIPELWNVIKGDLRIVGVKPLSMAEYSYAEKTWHQKRDQYPMGFTGLWYIQSIKANSLDQILIADAYYTATRTWYGDLKIILQTPLAGFRTRLVQDKMSVREDVFSANHTFNES